MAGIELTPTLLIVHVTGLDQLWALKSRLEIPLIHVRRVDVAEETAREGLHGAWKGLRLPGTSVPGVIAAGSFYSHGEWVFWDVHDPDKAIVIELTGEQYTRLVIQVDDPATVIVAIRQALARHM